jgi:hypothetical protein
MKKYSDYIIIGGFFAFLVIFAFLIIVLPKSEFSDMENRLLSSFPKISFSSIKDKETMTGIENYISDHFPLRTDWVEVKTDTEIAIGKRDINGVYILKNRFTQKITAVDNNTVDNNIKGINDFAERHEKPVFVCLVPTAAAAYADELPEYAPNLDQKTFINSVYNRLNSHINNLSVFDILQSDRDDYIYYRTDHHWTTRGAFVAYNAMAKKLGFTPLSMSSFDIEHATYDFYGSLFSEVLYNGIEPDTINLYITNTKTRVTSVNVTTNFGEPPQVFDSVYFREYLEKKNKYPVFLGENQPLVTINSTSSGGKLLIIKDSYANSFAPFLTEHYKKITLVDMRYINVSLEQVVDIDEYDQILFLYNVNSFNTDTNLRKLSFE